MPSQRKRPGRRSRSQGYCSASAASAVAATTVLISSLSSTSSALLASPACFVSRHHIRTGAGGPRTIVGSPLSRPQHHLSPKLPFLQHHSITSTKRSRLLAPLTMQNEDGIGEPNRNNEDDQEEEEGYNDIKSNLKKISWLPSVKLGKQPFKAPKISRKESTDGESYESVEGNSKSNAPPGFQNIEILPVLPMMMVHGMDGMLNDDTNNASDMEPLDLDTADQDAINNFVNGIESSLYGTGVWEEDPASSTIISTLGPLYSGTSSYLPHTKGHVFTVAEPRYKKLYDDLLRIGNYYGMKRHSALRRAKEQNGDGDGEYIMQSQESLPDPDEKRRFIVTAANPAKDGVFAEYGLLFELKDLDEVAAVASYEMGGEGGMTMEELQELVESVDMVDENDQLIENGEDVMDILLRTHYEATHDVVGRVKIHRFVNPECYEEGPDGEEYLMAEATILDVVENDRVKMLNERKSRAAREVEEEQQPEPASLTTARVIEEAKEQAVGEVAKAVARIKEELRSSVSDAFKQQQQLDPEKIKDKLRAALDEDPTLKSSLKSKDTGSKAGRKGPSIPLGPKGIYVERRSDDSLTKEERALRESFSRLVSLQHELKEECRFTRVSVQTFGIGPVGVWLSAAAWSQFVEKRLEAAHGDMQSDLQAKLVDYMTDRNNESGLSEYLMKYGGDENSGMDGALEGAESVDFDELSPELQAEFQLVQARATEELGPLALERAVQMQRIVQAESYTERLDLLRECVDNERRRLEAKKMLQSLGLDDIGIDGVERGDGSDSRAISRDDARSLFERLMSTDVNKDDQPKDLDEEAFQ